MKRLILPQQQTIRDILEAAVRGAKALNSLQDGDIVLISEGCNYGILIAYMQGILKRSIAMFPHILAEIEE